MVSEPFLLPSAHPTCSHHSHPLTLSSPYPHTSLGEVGIFYIQGGCPPLTRPDCNAFQNSCKANELGFVAMEAREAGLRRCLEEEEQGSLQAAKANCGETSQSPCTPHTPHFSPTSMHSSYSQSAPLLNLHTTF